MALIITIRTGELGLTFRFFLIFWCVCVCGVLFCFGFFSLVVFPDGASSLMMVNPCEVSSQKCSF